MYLKLILLLPPLLQASFHKQFQAMFGIGTKPTNKKAFYMVYATKPEYANALFHATNTSGNPIPFDHCGVRCIIICKPTTDKAIQELLTQYKLTVKDPCSMWRGICYGNMHTKVTREDLDAITKVDDITAVVYHFKLNVNKAFLDVFTDNPFKSAARLASHIPIPLFKEGKHTIIGQIGKHAKQPHMRSTHAHTPM
eukprot:15325496-Ditylum_brightwellii.AAC.1